MHLFLLKNSQLIKNSKYVINKNLILENLDFMAKNKEKSKLITLILRNIWSKFYVE